MLQPLLQIVPPGGGGVRDFALALQSQWAQAGQASDLWSLNASSVRSQALYQKLRATPASPGATHAVLLHFSGYGYHRRGLCFWLLRELRLAQQHAAGKLHLVVMFHELFASSPPWQSAFWLKPAQSHIAKKLAGLADAAWTNSEHHAQWLSQHTAAHAALHVQPVFSTMGEPVVVTQPSTRAAGLVVFGSASTRQRALALLAQHLPLVQALGVKAVIEAGSGAPCASAQSLPGYQFAGKLDPHALSDLLQHNLFALIDYPSIHLGKSTVFAAYAANGCVVLNTAAPGADADGLEAGVHYLSLPGLRKRPLQDAHAAPRWQQITVAAQSWYAQHTLPHQAAEFLAVLREHKVKPAAGLASAPLRQEAAHG